MEERRKRRFLVALLGASGGIVKNGENRSFTANHYARAKMWLTEDGIGLSHQQSVLKVIKLVFYLVLSN